MSVEPTIHRHVDGGFVWTLCPEHGPDVKVDEDGCCVGCGADATFFGREPAQAAPVLEDAADEIDEVTAQRNALLEVLRAHDVYMRAAGYSGPDSDALHPNAAENWRRILALLARIDGGAPNGE